jgi:farnesyl diphosphate synthase
LEFSQWALAARQDVEAALRQALETRAPAIRMRGDQRLHEAMAYGVLGGGKRIRALLAVAAGEAASASRQDCIKVGAAIECIHAFSLVHDDMPCMDDDALRRGQPTVHVKFGQAQALLVGDALQTLGFELLTRLSVSAQQAIDLVRVMARATGLQGMAGGQAVDIEAVGQEMSQEALQAMHALKTGALISAAVEMGALCGSISEQERSALGRFAARVGLGFQVADDVLDVSADAQTLGKTPGKDAAAGKPTFVALLGLAGAQDYARGLHQSAIAELAAFGPRADRLREVAQALLGRTH